MNIYTEEYHGYFTLELGYYQGNGFDSTELREAYVNSKRISCTYYPEVNEFRGNRKLQICVTGYRIEES